MKTRISEKTSSYYSNLLRAWSSGAFIGSDLIREAADMLDAQSRQIDRSVSIDQFPISHDVRDCLEQLHEALRDSPAPDHIVIDRDCAGVVIRKLSWMLEYEKSLNARATVETVLFDVSAGKRDALTPQDCRDLASVLGVPIEWSSKTEKEAVS